MRTLRGLRAVCGARPPVLSYAAAAKDPPQNLCVCVSLALRVYVIPMCVGPRPACLCVLIIHSVAVPPQPLGYTGLGLGAVPLYSVIVCATPRRLQG